jgi:hypothetical protein
VRLRAVQSTGRSFRSRPSTQRQITCSTRPSLLEDACRKARAVSPFTRHQSCR